MSAQLVNPLFIYLPAFQTWHTNISVLRYHKTHGHTSQQLHENGDGTFSIVNPETSAPYPGTMGMEKEKPFKCEVCGKRYKNLNGLKYVRSPPPLPLWLSVCPPPFTLPLLPSPVFFELAN